MAHPIPSTRSGVFISYARNDGEDFARTRSAQVEAGHIAVWQDLTGMEGGRAWWEQIKEALDHVDYMCSLMTPAALQSATVRKEWRYASRRASASTP